MNTRRRLVVKSSFAQQFLVNGAQQHREAGMFVAFEETPRRIVGNAAAKRREIYRLHEWLLKHELAALITAKAGGDDVSSIIFNHSVVLCEYQRPCAGRSVAERLECGELSGARYGLNVLRFASPDGAGYEAWISAEVDDWARVRWVGARAVSEAQSAVVGPSDELGSPHETENYAC
jgi:hypothetical protein